MTTHRSFTFTSICCAAVLLFSACGGGDADGDDGGAPSPDSGSPSSCPNGQSLAAGMCVPDCSSPGPGCGAHGECAFDDQTGTFCACAPGYAGDLCNACASGYVESEGHCAFDFDGVMSSGPSYWYTAYAWRSSLLAGVTVASGRVTNIANLGTAVSVSAQGPGGGGDAPFLDEDEDGRAFLRFDEDDYLTLSSLADIGSTPVTIIAVVRTRTDTDGGVVLSVMLNDFGPDVTMSALRVTAFDAFRYDHIDDQLTFTPSVARDADTWRIVVATHYLGEGGTPPVHTLGDELTTATATTAASPALPADSYSGFIGVDDALDDFEGDLGELLIYPHVPPPDALETVRAYLLARWRGAAPAKPNIAMAAAQESP